jgi:hypothetical protein
LRLLVKPFREINFIYVTNQLARKCMLWFGENVKHIAFFHNDTAGHYRHAMADAFNDVHLMGDQYHGDAELFINVF